MLEVQSSRAFTLNLAVLKNITPMKAKLVNPCNTLQNGVSLRNNRKVLFEEINMFVPIPRTVVNIQVHTVI